MRLFKNKNKDNNKGQPLGQDKPQTKEDIIQVRAAEIKTEMDEKINFLETLYSKKGLSHNPMEVKESVEISSELATLKGLRYKTLRLASYENNALNEMEAKLTQRDYAEYKRGSRFATKDEKTGKYRETTPEEKAKFDQSQKTATQQNTNKKNQQKTSKETEYVSPVTKVFDELKQQKQQRHAEGEALQKKLESGEITVDQMTAHERNIYYMCYPDQAKALGIEYSLQAEHDEALQEIYREHDEKLKKLEQERKELEEKIEENKKQLAKQLEETQKIGAEYAKTHPEIYFTYTKEDLEKLRNKKTNTSGKTF